MFFLDKNRPRSGRSFFWMFFWISKKIKMLELFLDIFPKALKKTLITLHTKSPFTGMCDKMTHIVYVSGTFFFGEVSLGEFLLQNVSKLVLDLFCPRRTRKKKFQKNLSFFRRKKNCRNFGFTVFSDFFLIFSEFFKFSKIFHFFQIFEIFFQNFQNFLFQKNIFSTKKI